MVHNQAIQWYQRCGFASLDDLGSPHWKEVFRGLEEVQSDFLSQEGCFRSPGYGWARDALHFVARPWEYAYVLSNLTDWSGSHPPARRPKVMDFGSGVTFFPFALARHDFDVTAVDIDPIAQRDFARAMGVVSTSPGKVDFLLSGRDNTTRAADSSFDCVYSISVLEHVADPIMAAAELIRVLGPHGFLILTFDVCFQGGAGISPVPYRELTAYLRDNLELVWPEVSIHPSRTISCYNGPYPYSVQCGLSRRLWNAGKKCVGRIAGRPVLPLDCLVMGMVLRKI